MTKTLKRAKDLKKPTVRTLLGRDYSEDEAARVFAVLVRIEQLASEYTGHIWPKHIPSKVRRLLQSLQSADNPKGLNKFIQLLMQTGKDQKAGIYRVYGRAITGQRVVFKKTAAYREAFERLKQTGGPESPPVDE